MTSLLDNGQTTNLSYTSLIAYKPLQKRRDVDKHYSDSKPTKTVPL